MRKFDTKVQELKYNVLRVVSKEYFEGTINDNYYAIPKMISPGPEATMRCCVYKERAILLERMRIILKKRDIKENIVKVIDIACDDCPMGGYQVTNICRGCIAHRCENACRIKAISFDPVTRTAIIDKIKCVNCGLCAKACQYNAIINYKRPCQNVCKVNAITINENRAAKINDDKCIQCGACVASCPFGAIVDKSFITDVIDLIKDSDFSRKYHLYAVVAPSIASQFKYATLGQIVSAIKKLGFYNVIEAASGADIVALKEGKELVEKGFLTSSCCPAFVNYIEKHQPLLKEHISHNLSPMAEISKYIKEIDKDAKTVFIGPCIAKKAEISRETVAPYVDSAITFEELQALIDALDIHASQLEESNWDTASYFGRIFGRCGGLTEAVKQSLNEQNIEFELKPASADGIDNVKSMANKAKSPNREFNFLEGMVCVGGCIGGPGALTHEFKDVGELNKYSKAAKKISIIEAVKELKKDE